MERVLKVGIVGFGGAGIAQFAHFTSMENCEISAIYDPKQAGLARAQKMAPWVLATSNFQDFMACEIDAIAVCSPDRTHADYLIAALEAGKHVICEKPLTDNLADCQRILDVEAKAKGVVAAVQHQMRFLPVHLEMKKLIRSGILGRISYLEGYYVHNLTERAYLFDNWRFTDNATPLVYSGCHFVDLLRWLLDEEVEEVVGMANHLAFPEYRESDTNVLLFRFKSGVIGKIVVAFGAARPQDHSVRIYGNRMSIENNLLFSKDGSFTVFARPHLANDAFPVFVSQPIYTYRGFRGRIGKCIETLRRYRTYCFARLFERLMHLYGRDPEYGVLSYPLRLYPHRLAVRASLENFVKTIRGKESLQCSLRESAKTVATCLAGVEAYRTGKSIKVSGFWLADFDRR